MPRSLTSRFAAVTGLLFMLHVAAAVHAQAERTRYISDETAVTLREGKGLDSPVAGLLKTGTRLELLEEDPQSGYSRVRVGPKREGWVLGRYLSTEPAARERLVEAEEKLKEQIARVRILESDNARLREAGAEGRSPLELGNPPITSADDVPREQEYGAPDSQSGLGPDSMAMMVTGAGLFVAGLMAGLIIPMIPKPKRRKRWSPDL